MSEAEVVARTHGAPLTVPRLSEGFRDLGLGPGAIVLAHSSLSSLGYVVGGAQAVILALEEAIGPSGTLMMPAHSHSAPEPSRWVNPPVPESWWPTIRAEWPAFDVDLTPTRALGTIAESFRRQRGTVRSLHPNVSFAARGPMAEALLADHSLDLGLGEGSPLARLYDHHGSVLLIGVDHGSNTSLHLAEYRARWPGRDRRVALRAGIVRGDRTETVEFTDIDGSSDDFARLGADYERDAGRVRVGRVGLAEVRLLPQRPLVDYAVDWIAAHRAGTG